MGGIAGRLGGGGERDEEVVHAPVLGRQRPPGGAVGLRGRDVSVLSEVDGALAALLGNPRDLAGPPTVVVGKYPRPNSIANLYPARRPSTTRATTSPRRRHAGDPQDDLDRRVRSPSALPRRMALVRTARGSGPVSGGEPNKQWPIQAVAPTSRGNAPRIRRP